MYQSWSVNAVCCSVLLLLSFSTQGLCLSSCLSRLAALAKSTGTNVTTEWLDPDTAASECTIELCSDGGPLGTCAPGANETLVLVFSDEFNTSGRSFAAGKDKRWQAINLFSSATNDQEVYTDDAVTTKGGAAVIKISKAEVSAPTQLIDGTSFNVSKGIKSGMVQSWNKFCYTGGYLEASVKLPGDHITSGFWPAFWTMGNLGRASFLESTYGHWPYSYNTCKSSGKIPWSASPGQSISACPDPPGVNRSRFGMAPLVGRGAPEIDIFEVGVSSTGDAPPHASQSLQMAPLLPKGLHWLNASFYASNNITPGVKFAGSSVSPFYTDLTKWRGDMSTDGAPDRPGNLYQDSIGANSFLNASFFTGFHKWGLDWVPGQYLRWYIDDQFVYEVNKNALLGRTNAAGESVGDRQIPVEAMYIIFNVALSNDFALIKENLVYPATMEIDYIRLYQRPANISLGCSPAAYPTQQYIACNAKKYFAGAIDWDLVGGRCNSSAQA